MSTQRYIIFNYQTNEIKGEVTLSDESANHLNSMVSHTRIALVLIPKHSTEAVAENLMPLARKILLELQ